MDPQRALPLPSEIDSLQEIDLLLSPKEEPCAVLPRLPIPFALLCFQQKLSCISLSFIQINTKCNRPDQCFTQAETWEKVNDDTTSALNIIKYIEINILRKTQSKYQWIRNLFHSVSPQCSFLNNLRLKMHQLAKKLITGPFKDVSCRDHHRLTKENQNY